jgi:hypothetical protein
MWKTFCATTRRSLGCAEGNCEILLKAPFAPSDQLLGRIMHRVMQHRISRIFLAKDGTLTPYVWLAGEFANLGCAVRVCHRFNLAPSDFSFRVFDHEPGEELQALVHPRPRTGALQNS